MSPTCSSRRALCSCTSTLCCSGRPAASCSSVRSPRIFSRRAATSHAGSQCVGDTDLFTPFTCSASARAARICSPGVPGGAVSPGCLGSSRAVSLGWHSAAAGEDLVVPALPGSVMHSSRKVRAEPVAQCGAGQQDVSHCKRASHQRTFCTWLWGSQCV